MSGILTIRHVRKHYDLGNGVKVQSFQHFLSGRCFTFSRYRGLPLKSRLPVPNSSYNFHQTEGTKSFCNYADDCEILKNGIVEETIGRTPSAHRSDELGDKDLFASFLHSLTVHIERDVNAIISQIDDRAFPNTDSRDSTSISSFIAPDETKRSKHEKTVSSPIKNNLRNRWERILRKEKRRLCRRSRISPNYSNFQNKKPPIATQWGDALRRFGFGTIQGSFEVNQASDGFKTKNDEGDLALQDIHISPIYRMKINQHQNLEDFEAQLPIQRKDDSDPNRAKFEMQPIALRRTTNDKITKWNTIDMRNNAILQSISLLIAMTPEDWRTDWSIQTNFEKKIGTDTNVVLKTALREVISPEKKPVDRDTHPSHIQDKRSKVPIFFQRAVEHKYVLTTSLMNLLLAHLVTSNERDNEDVGRGCLQLFEEMKMLEGSGQHKCGPDSITYRILILAFSRRFQGMDEAVMLSQDMIVNSSIDISPELLNDALEACRVKNELTVARILIDSALSNHQIRINGGSCITFTDILKTRNFHEEAIDFYCRMKKAERFTNDDEDEYLMSLCRWPGRNRRGDVIDLSLFWKEILYILQQKTSSTKIPDIRLWIAFLNGLYNSAKNDDSLWKLIAEATTTILDTYPRNFVGRKLTTIGLEASCNTEDPELASLILKRVADEPNAQNTPSNPSIDNSQTIMRAPKVPFRAIKNLLQICLKTSNVESATSIRESLEKLGDLYPTGAKRELHSLVLMCHAKVNNAETARRDLDAMIENKMKPNEELYSVVLRTMAMTDRYQEMEELFQSMQMTTEERIKPGILTYDAIMLARIRVESWDGVLALYEQIKAKGIIPSSTTVKGLIIANHHKGGRESVVSALESLFQCNAQFDESVFRLASKTLFKIVDENSEDFRKSIREMGEQNENLRATSLEFVRSFRFAEIESSRPKIVHKSKSDVKLSGEEAWKLATACLLNFVKASSENTRDAE